jgi:hypothetical protein
MTQNHEKSWICDLLVLEGAALKAANMRSRSSTAFPGWGRSQTKYASLAAMAMALRALSISAAQPKTACFEILILFYCNWDLCKCGVEGKGGFAGSIHFMRDFLIHASRLTGCLGSPRSLKSLKCGTVATTKTGRK